jgi:hypothetical protein
MSEKLPYEEQLQHKWDDLPLPDEDMAWKDMKRRLDEEDDDGIIVPPPPAGCRGLGILLSLVLLGGLWWMLHPEKWFMKNETKTVQQSSFDNKQQNINGNKTEKKPDDKSENSAEKTNRNDMNERRPDRIVTNKTTTDTSLQRNSISKDGSRVGTIQTQKSEAVRSQKALLVRDDKQKIVNPVPQKQIRRKEPDNKREPDSKSNIITLLSDKTLTGEKTKPDSLVAYSKVAPADFEKKNIVSDSLNIISKNQPDTVQRKIEDSAASKIRNPPVNNNPLPREKEKEKKSVFFSGGVGLHQQIPIGGQKWVTYGSLGRKEILTDYIPSLNFRMEKENRWFLQVEFRYGAPQHTKQFVYSQKIVNDTPNQVTNTTSSVLRKTFYHQLPLTVNYYILPNWSVGAGVVWNKFHSAVSELEAKRRNFGTQIDSVISKTTLRVKSDSSLAKSWSQVIFQTQYQWKRFSFGVRYSAGLEPYIRFTLPGLPPQQERNNSFQVFLRYELWKSKEK